MLLVSKGSSKLGVLKIKTLSLHLFCRLVSTSDNNFKFYYLFILLTSIASAISLTFLEQKPSFVASLSYPRTILLKMIFNENLNDKN